MISDRCEVGEIVSENAVDGRKEPTRVIGIVKVALVQDAPSALMSWRTRLKSEPFPLSPMKATFRLGSAGIGPGAPCAYPRAGPRAIARRAVRTPPAMRLETPWVYCLPPRMVIIVGLP